MDWDELQEAIDVIAKQLDISNPYLNIELDIIHEAKALHVRKSRDKLLARFTNLSGGSLQCIYIYIYIYVCMYVLMIIVIEFNHALYLRTPISAGS